MKTLIPTLLLSTTLLITSGLALAGVDRPSPQAQPLVTASPFSAAEIRLMVGTAIMADATQAEIARLRLKEIYDLHLDLQERIAQTVLDLVDQYPQHESEARQLIVGMLSD